MSSTQQVERSIATAEELDSVVGTMKGLAAVSLRQYERAEEALESYVWTLETALRIALRSGLPPLAEPEPGPPVGVFVVGAEQGLCGPLDRRLLEHVGGWFAEEGIDPEERRVVGVGTRLNDELHAYGMRAERRVAHPGSVEGVTDTVRELLLHLDEWRGSGIDRVLAFHHRRTGHTGSVPVTTPILPLDPSYLKELAGRPWETDVLPQLADDPETVLRALLRNLLFARLFRALVEASASEHAGRLAAMQGAEENVEERLGELRTAYRRQRQAAITQELLEVIGGYEALAGAEGGPA